MREYNRHVVQTCKNCGKEAPEAYCAYCGQSTKTTLPSLIELLTDGLAAVFSYDGRLWNTLRLLITRPGGLTKEYLDGRRQPYLSPLQLFIWLQAITFLVHRLWIDSGNTDRINHLVLVLGALFWIALSIVYLDRREPVIKHLLTTVHLWSFMMVFLLVLYGGAPLVLASLHFFGQNTEGLQMGKIMDILTVATMAAYTVPSLARVYAHSFAVALIRAFLVILLTLGPFFLSRFVRF